MAIIGIDLGTTNTLATCWKDGEIVVIKNSLGNESTPSVVNVNNDNEVYVGEIASQKLGLETDRTVMEFKRDMGVNKTINIAGKNYSPEQLSAYVIKKVVRDAEAFLGEEVTEAVISVPAYFDDNRRTATKDAAELAGIKVERLINEPSAAALAYLHKNNYVSGTFMVIDFGGGTLDISILDSFEGVIEIISVAGDNQLGGKDINNCILDYFCEKNGLSYSKLSSKEKAALLRIAEQTKIALTTVNTAIMSMNIGDNIYEVSIDNQILSNIMKPILNRFSLPIKRAIKDAKLTIDMIDAIIPVGGSCKMPVIKRFIEHLTKKKIVMDIDPDKAVAIGAGIFAAMKQNNKAFSEIVMSDICPFSLGISAYDYKSKSSNMSFIIERNSVLPTSKTREYSLNMSKKNDGFTISIYQGENLDLDMNLKIGEIKINRPQTSATTIPCFVKFTYDINGILVVDVNVKDVATYTETIVNSDKKMSKEEINRRKKELLDIVEHSRMEEEITLIKTRMERLIENSCGTERESLINRYIYFNNIIDKVNGHQARVIIEEYNNALNYFENYNTGLEGLEDFDGFDYSDESGEENE